MEETGISSANQAFNLGCWVGLILCVLVVRMVFLVTKGGWIAPFRTALLLSIALAGFANFAAYRARIRSIDRRYRKKVLPQINQELVNLKISQEEFDKDAAQILSSEAALYKNLWGDSETGVSLLNEITIVEDGS